MIRFVSFLFKWLDICHWLSCHMPSFFCWPSWAFISSCTSISVRDKCNCWIFLLSFNHENGFYKQFLCVVSDPVLIIIWCCVTRWCQYGLLSVVVVDGKILPLMSKNNSLGKVASIFKYIIQKIKGRILKRVCFLFILCYDHK